MVAVIKAGDGDLKYVDGLDTESYCQNYASSDLLKTIFVDGVLVKDDKLQDIRARLKGLPMAG